MLELVHFVRTLSLYILYLFRMLSALFYPADQQGPTQLRWCLQAQHGIHDLVLIPHEVSNLLQVDHPLTHLAMAYHALSHAKIGSFKISGDAQHGTC